MYGGTRSTHSKCLNLPDIGNVNTMVEAASDAATEVHVAISSRELGAA